MIPKEFIKLYGENVEKLLEKNEFWELNFALLDEFISLQNKDFEFEFINKIMGIFLRMSENIAMENIMKIIFSSEFSYVVYGNSLENSIIFKDYMIKLILNIEKRIQQIKNGEQDELDGELYFPYALQLITRLILQNDLFLNEMLNSKEKLDWLMQNYIIKKSKFPFDFHISRNYILALIKIYFLLRKTAGFDQYIYLIFNEEFFPYLFSKIEDILFKINQPEPIEHWLWNANELSEEDLLNEGQVAEIKPIRKKLVFFFSVNSQKRY